MEQPAMSAKQNGKRKVKSSAAGQRGAGAATAAKPPVDQRSELRHNFNAQCELHVFEGGDVPPRIIHGLARNQSFKGICVVSEVKSPLRQGQPIEARVEARDDIPRYIAGTVASCRESRDGGYEIGIQVEAAGVVPIIGTDLEQAKQLYPWFAESLGNTKP